MAEFAVVTWSVTQGCIEKHEKSVRRILDYWHKNAEKFKLKSLRYYSRIPSDGSSDNRRVMVYEFDSPEDFEYFQREMLEDKKVGRLRNQFYANINMKTYKSEHWLEKQRALWLE